jgi:hypothetical protein
MKEADRQAPKRPVSA